MTGNLTVQKIDLAEKKLLKLVQDEPFNEEDNFKGLLTYDIETVGVLDIDNLSKINLRDGGQDNLKRSDWLIGRVIDIYPGKDNQVRVVRGKMEAEELARQLKKLYPLELSSLT
ncbi:hypothetical protein NPIL_151271 [Nephila pilipes]|uniref:DUF5641 domain-containing protein n=1 Tax=Nephila pilipes TaxID=299642 RepID=A0A8X6N7J7_NEPPI|nr:hypothetical protein NPIL_151271 [Nephila pilipes]